MKNQVITEITRQMLPYLDNAQMEHLQEVLQHCLWNVEITSSGKSNELFVRETNEEMLEMFLSAKRVKDVVKKHCVIMKLLYCECFQKLICMLQK